MTEPTDFPALRKHLAKLDAAALQRRVEELKETDYATLQRRLDAAADMRWWPGTTTRRGRGEDAKIIPFPKKRKKS